MYVITLFKNEFRSGPVLEEPIFAKSFSDTGSVLYSYLASLEKDFDYRFQSIEIYIPKTRTFFSCSNLSELDLSVFQNGEGGIMYIDWNTEDGFYAEYHITKIPGDDPDQLNQKQKGKQNYGL